MNDILDLAKSIGDLSEPVLIALGLNVLGWLLKVTPRVDNRWIPLVVCVAGLLFYPALSWPVPFALGHVVRDAISGFVIGAGSVGFNQLYRQHFGGQTNQSNETTNSG